MRDRVCKTNLAAVYLSAKYLPDSFQLNPPCGVSRKTFTQRRDKTPFRVESLVDQEMMETNFHSSTPARDVMSMVHSKYNSKYTMRSVSRDFYVIEILIQI